MPKTVSTAIKRGLPAEFRLAKFARNRSETISFILRNKLLSSRNYMFREIAIFANETKRNEFMRNGAVQRNWRNKQTILVTVKYLWVHLQPTVPAATRYSTVHLRCLFSYAIEVQPHLQGTSICNTTKYFYTYRIHLRDTYTPARYIYNYDVHLHLRCTATLSWNSFKYDFIRY